MKPLVPENVNVNVNTGAVADLAQLSDNVADNMVYVIASFTVCSIIRNIALAVLRK